MRVPVPLRSCQHSIFPLCLLSFTVCLSVSVCLSSIHPSVIYLCHHHCHPSVTYHGHPSRCDVVPRCGFERIQLTMSSTVLSSSAIRMSSLAEFPPEPTVWFSIEPFAAELRRFAETLVGSVVRKRFLPFRRPSLRLRDVRKAFSLDKVQCI